MFLSSSLSINIFCKQLYGSTKTPVHIYIDLSKAFDTLNFDILLSILKYYGLFEFPLKLITNYLTNRKQNVKFESCISNLAPILTGVPQGSILGSFLFGIYIHDLVIASSKWIVINTLYPLLNNR